MPTQRSSKSSKALTEFSSDDLPLLTLVGEHGALPLDLLARLAGSNLRLIRPRVQHLQREGRLLGTSYPADKHLWVRLRMAVARHLGMGYWTYPPSAVSLNHRRAIVEARLALTSERPEGHWITEQVFLHTGDSRPSAVPDGIFELGDERWAIEVQVSRRNAARLRARVELLLEQGYDRVLYFCTPDLFAPLAEVKEEFPDRLEARPATTASWFTPPKHRPQPGRYRPTAREARLLRLITEEGAIAEDQLALLARRKPASLAKDLVHLEGNALLERGFALPGSPSWVWCTYKGTRASGSSLTFLRKPGPSGFDYRRALMSIRLALTGPNRPGRWLTVRQLAHGRPRPIYVPMAALELEGHRTAIVVHVSQRLPLGHVSHTLSKLSSEYDAVLWHCVAKNIARARRLVQEEGFPNVEIRELPADTNGAT